MLKKFNGASSHISTSRDSVFTNRISGKKEKKIKASDLQNKTMFQQRLELCIIVLRGMKRRVANVYFQAYTSKKATCKSLANNILTPFITDVKTKVKVLL